MFKIIVIIILVLFAVIAVLLIASTINHEIQLRKEAKLHSPSGNIVEVNNTKLHVFSQGNGDTTLVFMSGHGTSNPVLDFKPLWIRMVDDYRIAVVEKSGYGWSETSDNPRDIDTILEETRKALELSDVKGPFVLFPHSMSGLEAIYWAQKYPDEVKAIIGLDPCTPESFDILPEPERIQLLALYIISRTGLSRFMPDTEVKKKFPLMKSADLTEEDKQKYLAVFYKSAFSKDMFREINSLRDNSRIVSEKEVPIGTPMYFFISDEQEASATGWKDTISEYLSKITIGKYMQLDTGHYVHYYRSDIISKESKAFLEELSEL